MGVKFAKQNGVLDWSFSHIQEEKKECKNCKLRIWGSVLGGKHEIWSELKEAI